MDRLRVLIIDDEKDVRESLRDTLREDDYEQPKWEVMGHGFENVRDVLREFKPDMVVLDLTEGGPSESVSAGNLSFEQIREVWFCPVVVYSAFLDECRFRHPLVTKVDKGTGGDLQVRERLRENVKHARMIRSVHTDFDNRVREALRDSVHALIEQVEAADDSVLPRAVRRLVAARVDEQQFGKSGLRAWERWVVPPLGDHPLTADLLKRKAAGAESPCDFRLVLTPSCDLVAGSGREPKADRVLVARCETLERLGEVQFQAGQCLGSKAKKKLRSILTEGMADNMLPIPQFRGVVPPMVANLRRLELLEWNGSSGSALQALGVTGGVVEEFHRVASTDSPFRELVVWAYLRVTGRPGMPNVDIDRWLDDISAHLKERGGRA